MSAMEFNLTAAILRAFNEQRDPIPDSDLDNEQPVTLSVTFNLGDLRKLRAIVMEVRNRQAMRQPPTPPTA